MRKQNGRCWPRGACDETRSPKTGVEQRCRSVSPADSSCHGHRTQGVARSLAVLYAACRQLHLGVAQDRRQAFYAAQLQLPGTFRAANAASGRPK